MSENFLNRPLEQMYVSADEDISTYGYLADFNSETLTTIAELAGCDANDVKAAYVQFDEYASETPTDISVTLVSGDGQTHSIKADEVSKTLEGFSEAIMSASQDADYANLKTKEFVDYNISNEQRQPSELALLNVQMQEELVEIHDETKAAMKDNPLIAEKVNALLEIAQKIADTIKEQGLVTQSTSKKGEIETNKFIVSVPPATQYKGKDENGNKVNEILTHKSDGSTIYAPQINHKIGGTTLTLYAKEDTSNGVNFSSLVAQRFDRDAHKSILAKNDEIQSGAFNKEAKAVAQAILDGGYVQVQQAERIPKGNRSQLASLAVEINKGFTQEGSKVLTDDGRTVNEAYAQYNPDEGYGERIKLRSHSEKNIVIELGVNKEGEPFAKATNFDIKNDDNTYASLYIRQPEDLDRPELAGVPKEIKDAVADFKQNYQQNKEQAQHKKSVKQQGRDD